MQASVNTYDNFVNSINSDETKEQYEYCLTQFLKYCQMNLDTFLKLPQDEISSLIINYLLQRKVSRQYKVVIFSAIKNACEMNDVILNWTKMKKFVRTDNRDNSINGKDRGYTSELRDKNDKFFAFVDFNADDNAGRIRQCPHCLEYGFHNKLGPKIKKKGEPIAPDDEQWLSCYQCGNTFPIHETHFESKIKDSVQTTSNPFDNESTFLSTDSRATQRRKGRKRKGDSHISKNKKIRIFKQR